MADTRLTRRLGKCYELAGKAALWGDWIDVPEGAELELVHGTIQRAPHPVNPHAWVEYDHPNPLIGRMVWEPSGESHLPADAFYALFGAVRHYGYTRAVASLVMMEAEHWGPWEGDYYEVKREGRRKAVTPRQTLKRAGTLETKGGVG